MSLGLEGRATTDASLAPERLTAAVAAGILSRSQADRLTTFWSEAAGDGAAASVSRVDAEEVRFARGFHDIFISIGIVVFLFGFVFGLRNELSLSVLTGAAAAIVWLFSEIFARKLRLALPSFLLSICFTPLFFIACVSLFAGYDGDAVPGGDQFETGDTLILVIPTLIAIAGAVLHYVRFKVPVGVTGITGCVLFLVAVLVEAALPGFMADHVVWFTLFAGLTSFILAMWFDSRDLARMTINSDKAFWLHLFAAPLLVHSILLLATGDGIGQNTEYAYLAIGLFLVLAFVAITVDRRALLVSGLGYFGVAIATLMTRADVSDETTLAVTLVLLGCFILLLGTAWRFVRRWIVAPLGGTALMRLVPAAT